MRGVTGLVLAVAALGAPAAQAQPRPDLSTCHGEHLRGYVGKPYLQLQRVRRDKARYVCSTCPMTMDFRADRLTVTFDARTRRIVGLRCV